MNKAILTSFGILFLLSTFFLIEYKISVKASPTTWVVDDDGPANFSSIQEAINSPSVVDRDTIFVNEGTYYEHVVVHKSLSLIGENKITTIIDGNYTGNVMNITASNVNIIGFTIQGSAKRYPYSGIFVDRSNDNDISHNNITDNYDGIGLYYSSNNVFSGNTISSNNYNGITLYYSSNNVFSGNTMTGNYDGITLLFSSNNVFSGNTISSNNNDGFYLTLSSNNVFSGNTISSNNYNGFSLYYSSNNVFSGNTMTGNYYGMYLYSSGNNTIYNNNFNNENQVWSDSTNAWDDGHPSAGNYWSDHDGTDFYSGPYQNINGSDGIGDSSYVIDANNQDNYPLMGMFSDFYVTLIRETYHMTTISNSTISEFRFEIGAETGSKIIRFNATGEDSTVGFCRIRIATELMNYPFIVLVGVEEIVPTLLDVSNETYVYLYFTYVHNRHTITIVSSRMLHLYNELLGNYSQLVNSYSELNSSYQEHLKSYLILLGNYSQLVNSYSELNSSYQEHLLDYPKSVHNIRNLMYAFAATTGIFIITTIYLSKHAHVRKTKMFEDKE